MLSLIHILCHNRDLKDEAVRPLYEKQIGFQYFPESVWGKCRTDENGFWYENQYYPVVMGDTGRFPNAPVPDLSKAVRDLSLIHISSDYCNHIYEGIRICERK